jgi:hypothetical protein
MQHAGCDEAVQAANDQSLFREVNERLRELNEAFETITRDSDFICECANRDCIEHLRVTLAEYEAVRAVSTRFLVLPGQAHVFPDYERVVERHDGHWVVEKEGDAGMAAIRLDPRRRPRRTPPSLS